MIFGEAGQFLLEDVRSGAAKPHRHAEIKTLRSENAYLDAKMEEIKREASGEISEELSMNYVMLKHFKERNERVMRCYMFHRMKLMFDAFFSKECIGHLLSADEEECAERYGGALDEYLEPFHMLDFSANEPPLQLFVQVLTLEDCGVVMDEEGLVELKKDRIYFVRKSLVMHLISSGLASVI